MKGFKGEIGNMIYFLDERFSGGHWQHESFYQNVF
jgi:hypothetical protein